MRILVLNPYDGGSHRAFIDGLRAHTTHDYEVLGLPARHWKWRMRHGAWTLASRARLLDATFDAVLTTDMLDVAAWRGLVGEPLCRTPLAVYFHENQLLYPDPNERERDLHFGFTNLISAAAADQVWFNSAWHRDALLDAATELAGRLPDFSPTDVIDRIRSSSLVAHPGVSLTHHQRDERAGVPHLLWAARWESDKRPQDFFAALRKLARDVRVSVIGYCGGREPEAFTAARAELGDAVVHWGYQTDRAAYERALCDADIFVSTAAHEFFGLAAVEAAGAGAYPLLPNRLAYPEVFEQFAAGGKDGAFYDGTVDGLATRLGELCDRHQAGDLWQGDPMRGRRAVADYAWAVRGPSFDAALARLGRQ